MTKVQQFGVIPVFKAIDGKLSVQKEILFPTEADALRAGEVFAQVLGGAVAFSRVFDPDTGAKQDGTMIGRFGVMAEPISEAAE